MRRRRRPTRPRAIPPPSRPRPGQTATAWARYREAAALAVRNADADRESVAKRSAAELESRLSFVVLTPPPTPLPPSSVIKRDGQTVYPADLGVPLPVDPGEHTIYLSAPGYRRWSATVTAGNGPAR